MDVSHADKTTEDQSIHCALSIPDAPNNILECNIKELKPTESKPSESIAELMQRIVGIDITLCKYCKFGHLEKIQMIMPNTLPTLWDTS